MNEQLRSILRDGWAFRGSRRSAVAHVSTPAASRRSDRPGANGAPLFARVGGAESPFHGGIYHPVSRPVSCTAGPPGVAGELLPGLQSDLDEHLDPGGDGPAKGTRLALFPVWFFAIAAVANGIAHPVLAVVGHGYFPGLITSPVLGVLGVLLGLRLLELTRRRSEPFFKQSY